MKDPAERIPILSFLIRHKWRIILPLVFALLYWGIPRYLTVFTSAQQTIFVKSDILTKKDIQQELSHVQNIVLGDEFLANLVVKYDLYKAEDSIEAKIEKLRRSIYLRVEHEDVDYGAAVIISTHFRNGNPEHVAEFTKDLAAPFEKVQGTRIEKFVAKPYDGTGGQNYLQILGSLFLGLFISIPLILVWEIPRMFYSQRTKEAVFDPLRSDWESELFDAKLSGEPWTSLVINIRYFFAFVSTIFQRSPAGDLIEFLRRVAG